MGITWNNNKILCDYLKFVEGEDNIFRRQFELFHKDFLVGLSDIMEYDKPAYQRYVQKINETKGKLNFWGERFEVYFHSKLLNGVPEFISSVRRGKDGSESDLQIQFKENNLGLELTTLKYKVPPKTEIQILSKITDCILEKNSKKYANDKSALIVDITNIVAYEKLFGIDLNSIFNSNFNGFSYLNKEIKFGKIILGNSVFKEKSDGNLVHRFIPRIGFMSETLEMDSGLKEFLNLLFNRFKPDTDFDKLFYHINM